jgi:transposase
LLIFKSSYSPICQDASEGTTSEARTSDGKRGGLKGHKGATRLRPEPDETIDVVDEECEKCGSHNIQETNEEDVRVIEDFVPPVKKTRVVRFVRHKMKCMDCGYEFFSRHPDCSQKGNFGVVLLVYITILKFHLRGVLQKIQEFLFYENDFDINVKGIHDVLLRVGDAYRIGYNKTLEQIRNASWVHIDETGNM